MSNEIKLYLTIEPDEDYICFYPSFEKLLINMLKATIEDDMKYKIKDLRLNEKQN